MSLKRRASSLVLVVVIMAGIVVVVFGATRLTLVQYNQSNRDEDNIFALYAAKAGIEDGLARFRYNRDAETSSVDGSTVTSQRFDLTTGESGGEVPATDPISSFKPLGSAVAKYTPSNQYYDMNLSFRTQSIGKFDNFATDPHTLTPAPIVSRDSDLELTGFPTSGDNYFLRVAFKFYNPGTSDACTNDSAFVQLQQVLEGGVGSYQQTTIHKLAGNPIYSSLTSGQSNLLVNSIAASTSLTTTLRLRPYFCDIGYAFTTSTAVDGQGVDSNGNPTDDAGPKFDSLTSEIRSTGYFGQAKRTLVADIDRTSGQLLHIYDFNVYAGTGDVKP